MKCIWHNSYLTYEVAANLGADFTEKELKDIGSLSPENHEFLNNTNRGLSATEW